MTATLEAPPTLALTFDANTFARGWLSASLARSKDDARPALTGVSIEFYQDGAQLIATDSYMLLRSWVPYSVEDAPEHTIDEAPLGTVVALDIYGRAESLMKHLLALTSGKDAPSYEITVSVGHDPREPDEASLPGVEPLYVIFDLPGQEIVTLRQYEGDYPDWRGLVSDFEAQSTTAVSFAPDMIVARLGKLGKLHAEKALQWTFGGAERAALIELMHAFPPVSGLAMPVRTHLPHLAPEIEDE